MEMEDYIVMFVDKEAGILIWIEEDQSYQILWDEIKMYVQYAKGETFNIDFYTTNKDNSK